MKHLLIIIGLFIMGGLFAQIDTLNPGVTPKTTAITIWNQSIIATNENSSNIDTIHYGIKSVNISYFGCDKDSSGSWNNSKIADAIIYAESLGVPLYIPSDTFLISSTITLNYTGNGFIGNGCLKKDSDFTSSYVLNVKGDLGIVNGITIDDDHVSNLPGSGTSNPLVYEGNNGNIRNCRIVNFSAHTYGIWIANCNNVVCENNYVRGGDYLDTIAGEGYENETMGIEVLNCDNIVVRNNYIMNVSNCGIYVWNTSDFNVSGNNIDSSNISIYIYVDAGGSHPFVENGIISNNTCGDNILLSGVENPISNLNINNNKLDSAQISVYHTDNSLIVGNTIRGKGRGIIIGGCSDLLILNNLIDTTSSNGIEIINYSGRRCNKINIFKNIISETIGSGIYSTGTDSLFISENLIINFNYTNNSANNSGTRIDAVDYCIITNNTVFVNHAFASYLMRLTNNTSLILKNNNISLGSATGSGKRIYESNNTKLTPHGTVTPSAASTSTTVTFPRYGDNSSVFAIQVYGSDINVRNTSFTGASTLTINHDSAVGDEKIFWMVLE
jgi:hypothetical protein